MAFLDNAAAWLDSTLETSDGESVLLRDGAAEATITAVIGATPVGSDLGNGILQTWMSTDFLIAAEDFVINGNDLVPAVGQELTRTIDGVAVPFRVVNADDGRCFRHTDPSRRTFRIHTKQVR